VTKLFVCLQTLSCCCALRISNKIIILTRSKVLEPAVILFPRLSAHFSLLSLSVAKFNHADDPGARSARASARAPTSFPINWRKRLKTRRMRKYNRQKLIKYSNEGQIRPNPKQQQHAQHTGPRRERSVRVRVVFYKLSFLFFIFVLFFSLFLIVESFPAN
jgi:hypothetical protein